MLVSLLYLISLLFVGTPIGTLAIGTLTIIVLKNTSKIDVAIVLLLTGKFVAGYATMILGIPLPLGKILSLVALIILNSRIPISKIFNNGNLIVTVLWTILIITFSYMNGPQTQICKAKFFDFVYNSIVYIISFSYLFKIKDINYKNIASLYLLSILIYLNITIIYELAPQLHNLWEIGSLRTARSLFPLDAKPLFNYQELGNMCVMTFIFLLSGSVDTTFKKKDLIQVFSISLVALIIIGISGSRQSLFMILFVVISLNFTKPIFLKRYRILTAIFISIGVLFVFIGITSESHIFVKILESNSVEESLNRGSNFESAYYIIQKEPLFGTGFGGYYIPGYSRPGEMRLYAHNLFLELLTETGIIGTILYLGSWLISYFLNSQNKVFLTFRTLRMPNGIVALPFFLYFATRSMISTNLTWSVGSFIILFLIIQNLPVNKRNL